MAAATIGAIGGIASGISSLFGGSGGSGTSQLNSIIQQNAQQEQQLEAFTNTVTRQQQLYEAVEKAFDDAPHQLS